MKNLFIAAFAIVALAALAGSQLKTGQSSIACGGCTNSVACGGCTNNFACGSECTNHFACGGCTNDMFLALQ